jgi:hypothetical protein
MKLAEYPEAIARLQYQILDLDQRVISLAESVKVFEAEIDKQIAFDSTLKNDSQRKARRIELQQTDGDYYTASRQLLETKSKRDLLQIQLSLVQNQFSVLKLEKREAIAQVEATTAA